MESFDEDAQSFLLLEYLGQGLSQIGHLKPLSVGERLQYTNPDIENGLVHIHKFSPNLFKSGVVMHYIL